MRPDIKARWVAALRSGEYQQGRANLCTEDSSGKHFCCLGVLCDLAVQDGVVAWEEAEVDECHDLDLAEPIQYGVSSEFDVLPREVAEWAGFSVTNTEDGWQPRVELTGVTRLLPVYAVNDGLAITHATEPLSILPHTFAQLADLIEQQL